MSFKNKTASFATFVCLLVLTMLISSGCTSTPTDTAPVATINANANKSTPAPTVPPLEAREPDRYSITNTITITPTGTSPQTNIPPLQFSFAKLETYRRVSFKLPDPVGDVIYLDEQRGGFVELIGSPGVLRGDSEDAIIAITAPRGMSSKPCSRVLAVMPGGGTSPMREPGGNCNSAAPADAPNGSAIVAAAASRNSKFIANCPRFGWV